MAKVARSAAAEMLDRMASGGSSRKPGPSAWGSPLSAYNGYVSSGFGRRSSPGGIGSRNHAGIDLSAGPGVGGYPAEAAAGGIVTQAGRVGGYGNLVEVQHDNGYRSRYGHLEKIGVKVGDRIARGTPIGLVGSTGRSTSPHLHFEVRDPAGRPVDPRSIVDFSSRTPTPSARPASTDTSSIVSAYADFARDRPAPSPSISGPNPSRFGGTSYSGPSAPMSPAGGYARAQAPTISTPTAERFGRVAAPDPARFAGSFSSVGPSAPMSPAGGYASVTRAAPQMASAERFARSPAPSIDPARFGPPAIASVSAPFSPAGAYAVAAAPAPDPTATASIQRGLAGNLMGMPATPVSPTSVAPSAMPGNMLSPTFTPPALDMAALNAFQPQATPLMPAPNMPVALPAPPLQQPPPVVVPQMPPPRVVRDMPVYSPPAPPQFTPADIYGGQIGQATASDGNVVGRDPFGMTTVTNKYGVTTAMTPTGKQSAYGTGMPGPVGRTSLFGGSMPSLGLPGPSKGMVGGFLGGMAGNMVGGPIGGLLGAVVGNAIANGGMGFGNRGGFPSAPGTFGERAGPSLSRGERASISPAADRSMASNGGRMTGLW